jgi:hypothetical protein
MTTKLCISTVVDRKYQYYIPLFVLSLKHSYPEYSIKLFTHGRMSPEVMEALEIVDHDKCELVPGLFRGWKKSEYAPISWRFLVHPDHYAEFNYVYITDIDMMITKERVPLYSFHRREMKAKKMCYSNSKRHRKHWKGSKSLSGLHFCNQKWFEKTEKARSHFEKLVKKGAKGTTKREYDGYMLYRMVIKSKLKMCEKRPLVRRHHGLHLGGNFRLFKKQSKIDKRMDRKKCKQWIALIQTPEYKRVYKLIKVDKTVKKQLKWLKAHCRRMLK